MKSQTDMNREGKNQRQRDEETRMKRERQRQRQTWDGLLGPARSFTESPGRDLVC